MNLDILKYPIGTYKTATNISLDDIEAFITRIAVLPERLRAVAEQLDPDQLDTPYRPEGWTVRQVIHHIPDSHMNAYIRFKLALTEENPTIRPYLENEWASLPDNLLTPIDVSLDILSALHARWVVLLKTLSEKDMQKTFFHPEQKKNFRLDDTLGSYAWHGDHHLAHITSLIARKNW